MKRSKMIIASIVLALILLIGGAVAYFTDTQSVTNTFTLGSVKIELTEPSWDEENGKNLVPGTEVAKDPTIKNIGRNKAFVFIQTEEPCYNGGELLQYVVNEEWTEISGNVCTDSEPVTKTYAYGTSSAMTELDIQESTTTLFDSVTMDPALTQDDYTAVSGIDLKIVVTAYGIQTTNLENETPNNIFDNFSNFS